MNQSRTIRLPVHVVKEINVILRALRHPELANGKGNQRRADRAPDRQTDRRRAAGADAQRAYCLARRAAWKSTPITIADAIADDNSIDPEGLLQANEVGELVGNWVDQLPEKAAARPRTALRSGRRGYQHPRRSGGRTQPDARACAADSDRSARPVAAGDQAWAA